MRVPRRLWSWKRSRQTAAELAQLKKPGRGRACGEGCQFRCGQCGSTSCQCRCSPTCPDAPKQLSIDADRYPIEPRVLPLVFAMKRLKVFDPCWSCEGHLAADGSLWKAPMVWFYCQSTIYLRILKDGLSQLSLSGRLRSPWEVVVTFSDPDNPDTTFSLQPANRLQGAIELQGLQSDIGEIAKTMDSFMEAGADALARNKRPA